MPLALKTQSFFERLKKFVLALIDRILPKKHKLSLPRGQRSTMAKQLVLSTGYAVLFFECLSWVVLACPDCPLCHTPKRQGSQRRHMLIFRALSHLQ